MALQPGRYIILSAWNLNVTPGGPKDPPADGAAGNIVEDGFSKIWTLAVAQNEPGYYLTLAETPVIMFSRLGGDVGFPVADTQGPPRAWNIQPEPGGDATFTIRAGNEAWYMGSEAPGSIIGLYPLEEGDQRGRQVWRFILI